MRTKIVNQIFKKEILDILRDKKTIFMMIILPIILYPILMVGMTQVMSMSMNSMEKENINIAFNKKPDAILNEVIKETNVNRKKDNSEIGEVKIKESKDYKKDLNDGKISAFIEISQNDKFEDFKVYINSSNNSSSMAEKEIENPADVQTFDRLGYNFRRDLSSEIEYVFERKIME